jgi:hypothetical protein
MLQGGPISPPPEVMVLGGNLSTPGSFTIFDLPEVQLLVGSTHTLDSGPRFQQTVDYLTNGQNGLITFYLLFGGRGGGAGRGDPKSAFNGGYPGVELRGLTIEGLDLRIDSFSAPQPSAGNPEMGEAHITFVIRGEFPLWWRLLRNRYAFLVFGVLIGALFWFLLFPLLLGRPHRGKAISAESFTDVNDGNRGEAYDRAAISGVLDHRPVEREYPESQ